MRFQQFLRDRRLYIAAYCGFGLLTIAIVQLDLWLSGSSLQIGNILYIGLFGIIGLALWLAIDYRRQQKFFQQFEDQFQNKSVDQMSVLHRPLTLEQRLYSEAWSRLYGHLRAELATARDRNRLRIDLITQWAHHMKTPISVIDLELQKARQQVADTSPITDESARLAGDDSSPRVPIQHLIETMTEENERLRHSLHMLLNMIRLDDFAADFKIEQVPLIPVVRAVVNEHRRAFIAHKVYPKIDEPDPAIVSPNVLHVESDVKWLKFTLEQIVRNAITYSAKPDGNGNVTFSFYRGKDETILEVADDGSGIAQEDIGRVFAPFFTGAGGRQHNFSTGMGLYLAKVTCRRLGHRLTVQSVQGEGTHVRIHFTDDPSIYAGLGNVTTL